MKSEIFLCCEKLKEPPGRSKCVYIYIYIYIYIYVHMGWQRKTKMQPVFEEFIGCKERKKVVIFSLNSFKWYEFRAQPCIPFFESRWPCDYDQWHGWWEVTEYTGSEQGLWGHGWGSNSAPTACSVSLEKILNFSGPQFSPL